MRLIDADALIERIKYSFHNHERVRIDTVTETFLTEYCSPTINPEDLRPKWISVEERLPGTERVLITNGEFVKEGYRRPDGVWKYGRGEHMRWDKLSGNPITHWMPLPEPPGAKMEG